MADVPAPEGAPAVGISVYLSTLGDTESTGEAGACSCATSAMQFSQASGGGSVLATSFIWDGHTLL